MNKRMQWTALAAVLAVPAVQAGEARIGDTTLTWGGYVKVDALASRFSEGEVPQSTSRDFYVPGTIPVSAGGGNAHTSMDLHAKETRLFVKAETPVEGHKLGGYIEFDFISGQINSTINGIASGGGNEIDNLVGACRNCNIKKNAKDLQRFLQEMGVV